MKNFNITIRFLIIGLLSSGLYAQNWQSTSNRGVVVAGPGASADAGLAMLEQGGNAADAAVATIIALAITDYGMFCTGGECPFIIYDAAKDEVKVLSGLGGAPLDQDAIDWYMDNGIPTNSPNVRANIVPGAISLYFEALKLYGTLSFEQVVAPTLVILDAGGKNWYNELAATFRKLIEREQETIGTREEKLQAARDRFYKGDIADILDAWYIQEDAFLRKADLVAHVTHLEDPIMTTYKDYQVYKCNTWTQGGMLLETLNILEHFDLKSMGHLSVDYIHHIIEAMKLGFADRDAYFADPLF